MADTTREDFSLTFEGAAVDDHTIPATVLADSIVALKALIDKAGSVVNGKQTQIELKVKSGFKAGSFISELVLEHVALVTGIGSSLVTIVTGAIVCRKWLKGKKIVKQETVDQNNINVTREDGQTMTFNHSVIVMINNSRVSGQLDKFTRCLDNEGLDSIKIVNGRDQQETKITKADREVFKQGEGATITDEELPLWLEVCAAQTDGSMRGWRFILSASGQSFTANIEDQVFLNEVKEGKHTFMNGTTMHAIVHFLQRRTDKLRSEYSITEVKEIRQPSAFDATSASADVAQDAEHP